MLCVPPSPAGWVWTLARNGKVWRRQTATWTAWWTWCSMPPNTTPSRSRQSACLAGTRPCSPPATAAGCAYMWARGATMRWARCKWCPAPWAEKRCILKSRPPPRYRQKPPPSCDGLTPPQSFQQATPSSTPGWPTCGSSPCSHCLSQRMPKLPRVSGAKAIRALQASGLNTSTALKLAFW